MLLVGGFGCLELCLYGLRELLNQSEHSIWMMWTNESAPLHKQDLDEVEKRQHLIARLPNVETLNGGDKISEAEREEAERNFIRDFLDQPVHSRPARWVNNIYIGQVVVNFLEIFSKMKLKIEIFFKVVGAGEDPRQLGAAGEDRPQPLHRLQSGRVVGARGEGPHGLRQV